MLFLNLRLKFFLDNTNVASLTQEVVRILINCSEVLEDAKRVEHLYDLTMKMKTSGHNTLFIRKVMVAGIKNYEKKLKNSKLDPTNINYAPLLKNRNFNAAKRMESKMMA
jgi:hypothetical protein